MKSTLLMALDQIIGYLVTVFLKRHHLGSCLEELLDRVIAVLFEVQSYELRVMLCGECPRMHGPGAQLHLDRSLLISHYYVDATIPRLPRHSDVVRVCDRCSALDDSAFEATQLCGGVDNGPASTDVLHSGKIQRGLTRELLKNGRASLQTLRHLRGDTNRLGP